jgi:hypothetical protein
MVAVGVTATDGAGVTARASVVGLGAKERLGGEVAADDDVMAGSPHADISSDKTVRVTNNSLIVVQRRTGEESCRRAATTA